MVFPSYDCFMALSLRNLRWACTRKLYGDIRHFLGCTTSQPLSYASFYVSRPSLSQLSKQQTCGSTSAGTGRCTCLDSHLLPAQNSRWQPVVVLVVLLTDDSVELLTKNLPALLLISSASWQLSATNILPMNSSLHESIFAACNLEAWLKQ